MHRVVWWANRLESDKLLVSSNPPQSHQESGWMYFLAKFMIGWFFLWRRSEWSWRRRNAFTLGPIRWNRNFCIRIVRLNYRTWLSLNAGVSVCVGKKGTNGSGRRLRRLVKCNFPHFLFPVRAFLFRRQQNHGVRCGFGFDLMAPVGVFMPFLYGFYSSFLHIILRIADGMCFVLLLVSCF